MEARAADRGGDPPEERECKEWMDPRGRPWLRGRAAQGNQQLPLGAREKGREKRVDVPVPKETGERSWSEPSGHKEAAADARGQKQLRHALQKPAVLPEAGYEAETRP